MLNLPLILGVVSFCNGIYSALKVAHSISTWASEEGTKTIMSVDLVLYEKLYILVNGRADLQFMFVLLLGFCIFKSYWDFCSIIWQSLAWMKSRWLRENTVKQVFTCSVMLQALDCLKDIYLAVYFIFIRSLLIWTVCMLRERRQSAFFPSTYNCLSVVHILKKDKTEKE